MRTAKNEKYADFPTSSFHQRLKPYTVSKVAVVFFADVGLQWLLNITLISTLKFLRILQLYIAFQYSTLHSNKQQLINVRVPAVMLLH